MDEKDGQTQREMRFADVQLAQGAVDTAEGNLSREREAIHNYVDARFTDVQAIVDTHFAALQANVDANFAALRLAVDAVNTQRMARRLGDTHTLRTQPKDQAGQFTTKGELAAFLKKVYVGLGAVFALVVLFKFVKR